MPMYFPDLKSVRNCAEAMTQHKGGKQYKGIVPNTEQELLLARKQLADYFRKVWGDEIQACEIEYTATEENYDKIMGMALIGKIFQ